MSKDLFDWFIDLKQWLQKGMAETWFIKWLILLYGASFQDFYGAIFFGFVYGGISLIIGIVWDKLSLFHREAEFSNKRNWFMIEVRKINKKISRIENYIKSQGNGDHG